MQLSVVITILTVVVLTIQAWKELLPETKRSLRNKLLFTSIGLLAIVALLNCFNIYLKHKEDRAAKSSQRVVEIYEKVDALRIDILNEIFFIALNAGVVKSYAGFAMVDKQQNTGGYFKNEWMKLAEPEQKQALKDTEASLKRLQNIALSVMNLEETSPRIIPRQLVDWASTTLKIKLLTIPSYIDPSGKRPETGKYLENIGIGFDILKNIIREKSEYINLPKL